MWSSQHTPGMNEWGLGWLVIHSCIALVLREEERMSFGAFDVVVVVDWYIHEVAAVESEGCALFGFCEDIGPHYFCWAVHDFEIVVGCLITNEVISAFDVFCSLGTGE
jgi:hypothetical protein